MAKAAEEEEEQKKKNDEKKAKAKAAEEKKEARAQVRTFRAMFLSRCVVCVRTVFSCTNTYP